MAGQLMLRTLPNLRDLGGLKTVDGRMVRHGVIYRAANLSELDDNDRQALARLGIRTVYDLRTPGERSRQPNRLPAGAQVRLFDVLADSTGDAPTFLARMRQNPLAAKATLTPEMVTAVMTGVYREMIHLPSAARAFGGLFSDLGESRNQPVLIHCTAGKDRTGWAAASLLLLLGVPKDDMLRDYLRTNDDYLPAVQPLFDDFVARGGEAEHLRLMMSVQEAFLQVALAEMADRYGTVEGYFGEGLGIDERGQQRLRDLLLTEG